MEITETPIQQRYNQWDNKLSEHYLQLHPEAHYTIWDGVLFPDDYEKSVLKVMFLNREAYDTGGAEYWLHHDLQSKIKNGEEIFPYQYNLRKRLKQYLAVLNYEVSNGFKVVSDNAARDFVNSVDNDAFYEFMRGVAYCNVKKSDGKPQSDLDDLHINAKINLGILKSQISFYNPSIILAGDVCYRVLEDLLEWDDEELYIDPNRRIRVWILRINGEKYPFVDMFHPSRRSGMKEYYLDLLHAMQAIEINHPGFWQSHLGKDCFSAQ